MNKNFKNIFKMSQLTVERVQEQDDSPTDKDEAEQTANGVKEPAEKSATAKGAGDKTPIFADAFHMNIHVPPKHVLPKVDENPGKYVPMPYIFRLPAMTTASNVINQATRTPPFYVQLDHTIAVIWALFNKGEFGKSLGINQLQWALAFLRTIKNPKGRTPRDVAFCIDVISNELLDQYADLVEDVAVKHDIPQPMATSSKNEIGDNPQTLSSKIPSRGEMNKVSRDLNEKGEILVQQNVPFSINYADMITRSPPQLADKANAKPDCPEDEMAKNMGGFLNQWRKEQMKKILLELDRLHSIENYMGNAGGNFEPYMDDKDKEIAILLSEKMKQSRFT